MKIQMSEDTFNQLVIMAMASVIATTEAVQNAILLQSLEQVATVEKLSDDIRFKALIFGIKEQFKADVKMASLLEIVDRMWKEAKERPVSGFDPDINPNSKLIADGLYEVDDIDYIQMFKRGLAAEVAKQASNA